MRKIILLSTLSLFTTLLCQSDDLKLVLLEEGQRDPQAEEIFRDSLSGSASDALYNGVKLCVLQRNQTTIGFVTYNDLCNKSKPTRRIEHLAIAKTAQGKGYGKQLIQEIEEHAKRDHKEVLEVPYESDAKAFYKKLKFVNDPLQSCTLMKYLNHDTELIS